jgi:hypothetical protein
MHFPWTKYLPSSLIQKRTDITKNKKLCHDVVGHLTRKLTQSGFDLLTWLAHIKVKKQKKMRAKSDPCSFTIFEQIRASFFRETGVRWLLASPLQDMPCANSSITSHFLLGAYVFMC